MNKKVRHFLYQIFAAKSKRDSLITVTIGWLLLMGLLFSTSASMNTATTPTTTLVSFIKQIAFTAVGFFCYHAFSMTFDIQKCKKNIDMIVLVTLGLLLLAFIDCRFIRGSINNNYSWIRLPFGMSIQPSEFAKIVVVLIVACYFADRKFKSISSLWRCICHPLHYFVGILFIILVLQGDMGSAVICLFLGCLVFLIPDNKKIRGVQIGLIITAVFGVAFVVFAMFNPVGQKILEAVSTTFAARFRAVTNPSYSDDATREIFYSLLGISKGSIVGVGLGNSVQKFGYLVSSEADYIFPVIVEETGLLGIVFVFVPYALLIAELLRYAKLMENETDRVILIGSACYLFLHFFLNIGGASGLIPLTGVPLLFLSRGGSSLVAILIMLGMAQSVISKYEIEKEKRSIQTLI